MGDSDGAMDGVGVGFRVSMGAGYRMITLEGARTERGVGFAVSLAIGFCVSVGGSTEIAESKRRADAWPTLAEIAIRARERFMVTSKLVYEGRIQPGEFYAMKLLREL